MSENLFGQLYGAGKVASTGSATIFGVEIALVTNVQDPQKLGRVKVCFPRMSGMPESDWVRVVQPAGGPGRGFYWLPEVNDEVLVAFEMGQPNRPYVLRGLWNAKDKPMKDAYADDNTTRMIQTKSGHQIALYDKDGEEKITICDGSGKRVLTFDVKAKKLLIEAKEGSVELRAKKKIVLRSEDLEVHASKNAKLDVSKTFDLKIGSDGAMKAAGTFTLKGSQVQINPSSLSVAALAGAVAGAVAGAAKGGAKGAAAGAAAGASAGAGAGSAGAGAAAGAAAGATVQTQDVVDSPPAPRAAPAGGAAPAGPAAGASAPAAAGGSPAPAAGQPGPSASPGAAARPGGGSPAPAATTGSPTTPAGASTGGVAPEAAQSGAAGAPGGGSQPAQATPPGTGGSTPAGGQAQPSGAAQTPAAGPAAGTPAPLPDAVSVSVKMDPDQVAAGGTAKLSWTVQGDCDSLALDPATGAPAGFDAAHLALPSGQVALTLQEGDAAAAPDRKIAYTLIARPKGGGAAATASVNVQVGRAGQLAYTLVSCALGRGPLDAWMADASSQPFQVGSPAGPAIRCIRLALFWMGNAEVSALNNYNNDLASYVKAFQNSQLADAGIDARLSTLGKKKSDLVASGKFDRLTAALLDLALLDKNDLPDAYRYAGIRVKETSFSADPAGEKALAAKCIAVLDYWAGQGVKYASLPDREAIPPKVFPVGIAFGNNWFVATGNAGDKAGWQTDCSSSTLSAFFWATRGQIGDLDLAMDSSCGKHATAWEINPDRNTYPDGSTGVIVDLGVGAKIELSSDEQKAAADEIDADIKAKKIEAKDRATRIKARKLQKLVNKLRVGDCVQGWRYENSTSLSDKDRNAGHSFFIVDVEKDADGNVVKYTILTANTGTPGGVSRVQRNWSAYEDPRIGRFYKIEGE